MSKYLDLFVSEANEHLQSAAADIQKLSDGADPASSVNSLFRHFHSIKGMANSMGFDEIATLSHAAEEVFDRLRRRNEAPSPEETDVVLEAIDAVSAMVVSRAEGNTGPSADTGAIVTKIRSILPDAESRTTPPALAPEGRRAATMSAAADPSSGGTTRIPTHSLDRFLESISEIITRRETVREAIRLDDITSARGALDRLSQSIDALKEQVMLIRLMPFDHIIPRLSRSLRELCRKTGKRASLLVTGQEVSLDRSVLESLMDPLNHILRNAVDHGIEPPAERTAAGKAPEGSIRVQVERNADHVQIVVEDDGRGIDHSRIRERAVSGGYVSLEDLRGMKEDDVLMLTTLPGFSTASTVTDISGRGVGMDVIRTRIEALGGRMRILSRSGNGTRVEMLVPLTVAVLDAFLVEGRAGTFAVPSASVTGVREASALESETAGEGGHRIRRVSLDEILDAGANPGPGNSEAQSALIYDLDGSEIALVVDRIIERRQVVVKPLGSPLEHLRRYSGAALLDDGRVSLILDLANLGGRARRPA